MLKSYWLFLPLLLQGIVTAADETLFHWRRGLPRWERIGHALDTLTVLACMLWVLWIPPASRSVAVYAVLAVFSCIFVTKDEQVHQRHCPAAEHWLHAVLFMLHPVVLISVALLWPAAHNQTPMVAAISYAGSERALLWILFAATLLFGIYQFVYWNFLWRPENRTR
jgi:hypothetical protein